ncbi:MAG TPA: hypothetical protein VMT20_25725 [Terriglobia bacterium]|nr:hypothetical protein [Terriglobia bacterium]
MPETTKGALELLEEMRKEREDLDLLIKGLEKRLGITSEIPQNLGEKAPKPRQNISLDSVPFGFFHNLSQAAAAEKLLRLNPGQPLKTSQILEVFRRCGVETNPKNAITILYTSMKRSSKFERVAGKMWGLAEWYPERRRKQEGQEDLDEREE